MRVAAEPPATRGQGQVPPRPCRSPAGTARPGPRERGRAGAGGGGRIRRRKADLEADLAPQAIPLKKPKPRDMRGFP